MLLELSNMVWRIYATQPFPAAPTGRGRYRLAGAAGGGRVRLGSDGDFGAYGHSAADGYGDPGSAAAYGDTGAYRYPDADGYSRSAHAYAYGDARTDGDDGIRAVAVAGGGAVHR